MTMRYGADLGQGQVVHIQNQGVQTQITLSNTAAGQQQQQSNGFTTGAWTVPPALFRTGAGAIVRIQSAQGQTFIQLQSGSMQSLSQAPVLAGNEEIPLQQTPEQAFSSMPKMQPMQPMQPMKMGDMKMGDMEMQVQPMQMRMGNMEMRMGEPASSSQDSVRRFCTQCGSAVTLEDKFCAHCGFQLRAS